jgi:hypothetical protein
MYHQRLGDGDARGLQFPGRVGPDLGAAPRPFDHHQVWRHKPTQEVLFLFRLDDNLLLGQHAQFIRHIGLQRKLCQRDQRAVHVPPVPFQVRVHSRKGAAGGHGLDHLHDAERALTAGAF